MWRKVRKRGKKWIAAFVRRRLTSSIIKVERLTSPLLQLLGLDKRNKKKRKIPSMTVCKYLWAPMSSYSLTSMLPPHLLSFSWPVNSNCRRRRHLAKIWFTYSSCTFFGRVVCVPVLLLFVVFLQTQPWKRGQRLYMDKGFGCLTTDDQRPCTKNKTTLRI